MAIIKNPFMVVGDKNPLIANNEDELNALLTSKNAGKAVLYSGELYIVEGGEATENPTAVQLYTTPAGVPMTADTEEKANALLVENNVGRIFKYTGEAGASNAPIAIGDTLTAFYFDTSVTPDLASLDWDNPDATLEGMPLFYLVNANATPDMDGMLLSFVKMGEGSYAIAVAQSGMVYMTESGWDGESFDLSYLISQGYNTTVAYIGQSVSQDVWGKYISKEPFAGGGAYEKDALYLIAGSGSENPTAIGDTVTNVYFDTTKSAEEIYNALLQLDWDNPEISVDAQGFYLIDNGGSFDEGTRYGVFVMSMSGVIGIQTTVEGGGGLHFAYSTTVEPSALGLSSWGWQGSSPVAISPSFDIAEMKSKEIWGTWLSAHENGFASAGEIAAKKLQIAE